MARFRTLKMPDPDHLVKRLVAGNEVGVLSRLSRASFVGQRFVLINERLKEGEPTRAWGVVQLLQGRAIPSGPKAVETLGAKIDSLTAREFRGVPEQVWYHRLALVERYDPPREIKGTVPGRRYTGSIEMQKAMPKLSAKDEAEKRLEDAKIAANRKLPIATKRHRYVAAKFTLGNHYPRCAICGQTQPLSDWCNAPDMEEAALARQIDVAGSVEKCRYCDEPADSVLIAKEGGAGVPVCASHVPQGMEPDSTLELREIDKADVDPTELKSLSVSQLRQLLRILERDFASRDYNASKSEDLINSALFVMDELQRCREDVPDGQLVEEARKLRKQYAPVGASGEESGRLVKLEEVLNATTGDAVIR
ncbi:MAG: hypothetical protein GTN69_12320, partial [Armatimonadetes bacterium]|nr:hypothetical protein [Armatimonadota bacterium]